MRLRVLIGVATALAVAATVLPASAYHGGGFTTAVPPYAKSLTDAYDVKPLLSVGDTVPQIGDRTRKYQMVGIPDGLGARRNWLGWTDLYMNHEFGKGVLSEPVVGGPLNRGAIVSRYRLAADGSVLDGRRAYDKVFAENTPVGPAPDVTNTTSAFGRFCSAFLADWMVGFDRPVYLTGEESDGAGTFDGRGGQAVAIFDNGLHTLPKLGRFAKENAVVLPWTGPRTVVFPTEDGPSTPDSQIWMYVGKKDPSATDGLGRNGLNNGRLYVFVADGAKTEGDFTSGSINGKWVEIPGAEAMTEDELEIAADAVGALGMIRPEDAAAGNRWGEMFFVTTGSAYVDASGTTANELGRAYKLRVDPLNPTGPARLEVVYNADQIIAAGGDIAISPDNIDVSGRYLMISEDGTTESRAVMAAKGRDGSIWRLDLAAGYAAERVVSLNPPGRDGVAVGPGVWETSGTIDTTWQFGPGTWLFDVQAHKPTTAPAPNTVEDGQLLMLRPRS